MPALDDALESELEALRLLHRYRERIPCEPQGGAQVLRGGKTYLSFSSNDYFGLSQHPEVRAVSGGKGAGASALVTGYYSALEAFEAQLTSAKGTEAALVFGSGYLANIGTISTLMGKDDLILADKLSHACMLDGAKLSGATLKRFKHNDIAHLKTLLADRMNFRRCMILTETVFSMDGDRAPLAELSALAKEHDAILMTDDAHGIGIIETNPADIQMGTLSKGLGAYGGYVCASRTMIDYLVNYARSYIFTTALPPVVIAAASKALEILMQDENLRAKPLTLAKQFTDALGLAPAQSPIVPLMLGEDEAALKASCALAEEGYLVSAIRPPTVPQGTARLRFAFTALHEPQQIDALIKVIKRHGWHENSNT